MSKQEKKDQELISFKARLRESIKHRTEPFKGSLASRQHFAETETEQPSELDREQIGKEPTSFEKRLRERTQLSTEPFKGCLGKPV